MKWSPSFSIAALVLLTWGCGSATSGAPCEGDEPASACGASCAVDADCSLGFHCGADGACTAECAPGSDSCPAGSTCNGEGRCVGDDGRMDAGSDMVDAQLDANTCADVSLTTMQIIPSVVLIVDQSRSMETNDLTPGTTRWEALEEALVGPNGVAGPSGTGPGATGLVFDLQDQVRFGLALYSGDDTTCPLLSVSPDPLGGVSTGAYPAIKTIYDAASPIRWTPTHLAMEGVLDQVLAAPPPDPVLFILATDGEPNECASGTTAAAAPEVITQTQRAFDAGIRTYVVSLAGDDAALQAHLDQVANAGIGADPDATPPAMSFAPSDSAALSDALRTIIGGALSCTVELDGMVVPGMECAGRVELNGSALGCDDPNGWRLVDENHIELLGAACDTLLGEPGSTLTASFPCEAIVI